MNADVVPRFAPGVRSRKEQQGTSFLLVPEGVVELNDSAVSILDLVDGKRSLREIAGSLANNYEATPEQLTTDVDELCEALCSRGFLIS